ncbi:MAG: hypothetical protein GY771_03660, partial [bacterium]|nr:hypothetical protein [bacterium]
MRAVKILVILITVSLATIASANVLIDFPLDTDTWEVQSYPYWWHVGDTVYGDRDLGTEEFFYVWVTLPITYNGLDNSGEYIDFELQLSGNPLFDWSVVEGDGTGNVVYEGAISYTPSGTEEVRYYETNVIPHVAGSISIRATNGTVEFQT